MVINAWCVCVIQPLEEQIADNGSMHAEAFTDSAGKQLNPVSGARGTKPKGIDEGEE